MTTKAQDIVIDEMADEGTVFVEHLRIGGNVYATRRACVLNDRGRRVGPWWLIAEDGVTMSLPEPSGEQILERRRVYDDEAAGFIRSYDCDHDRRDRRVP